MDRADRLDLLARILRDRPGITTAALARELGTSPRSVFRDLARLRERGYPIEGGRGRGGGLRLDARWGLGSVRLATEEALGALLSFAVAEKLGFPMFASALAQARRKIAGAFPDAERRRIAPLRERIFVGPAASAAVRASYGPPAPGPIRELQAAFVAATIVRAAYVTGDGRHTTRRLEPHALLIQWPAWYLVAHDHTRGEPRTFRFDRFQTVTREAATFRPRPRAVAAAFLAGDLALDPV